MQIEAHADRLPLEECAEVTGGVTLGRAVPDGGSLELPYLRVANVQDGYIDTSDVKTIRILPSEINRFKLHRGDVLLTEGGDFDKLGRGAVWDGRINPCLHQNHVFRVRCIQSVMLPDFLTLYLSSHEGRKYFLSIAKQTTNLATINSSQLKSMPIPCPPLIEQQRIVEVLDAVGQMERSIEASIAKQRTMRLGILLTSLGSIDLKKSSEGWLRVPLKDVVPSTEYGISYALTDDPSGIPVLRMNNIRDGQADVSDLRYCPASIPNKLHLRRGDVLFNRTNSIDHVGKAALWLDDLPEASFASYLVRLNPDTSRLLPEYLVEWLHHPIVRQRVKAISTVAVQQVNVNPTRLRELEIDLPVDLADQRKIIDSLSACDELISRDQEELTKLRKLKLGLTDDLLAGKVH